MNPVTDDKKATSAASESPVSIEGGLVYKGYATMPEVDVVNNVVGGRVMGIRDVVHYEGATVAEAAQAFCDSVDDYLAWCEHDGREPDRPASGKLHLRLSPEAHRRARMAAQLAGLSLNDWIGRRVERGADEELAARA